MQAEQLDILTERLRIRPLEAGDAPRLAALGGRDAVQRAAGAGADAEQAVGLGPLGVKRAGGVDPLRLRVGVVLEGEHELDLRLGVQHVVAVPLHLAAALVDARLDRIVARPQRAVAEQRAQSALGVVEGGREVGPYCSNTGGGSPAR